jgi:hypothetical protein
MWIALFGSAEDVPAAAGAASGFGSIEIDCVTSIGEQSSTPLRAVGHFNCSEIFS